MYSKWCGDEGSRGLLQAAFDVLQREAPGYADEVCRQLGGLSVRLSVGDECYRPSVVAGKLVVNDMTGDEQVRVELGLPQLLALFEAEYTLHQALREDHLRVYGTIAQLHSAGVLFNAFLHGLVRCPSGAELLDRMTKMVSGEGIEHA